MVQTPQSPGAIIPDEIGTANTMAEYKAFIETHTAPESDAEKLARWQRALAYNESKDTSVNRIAAANLRRQIRTLTRRMEGGQS